MRPRSLRNRLLLIVSVLVIGSGMIISFIVTQRYGSTLLSATAGEAGHLAHALSSEATDKILINDMVSLQKLLDYHKGGNPSISYLFVIKDGQVLSHTFGSGIPAELIDANTAISADRFSLKRIASIEGDHYIDIAYPVFSGKAGVLRLGFSEKNYRKQVISLGIQMSILTLVVLLLALAISYFFIRRVTRPLAELADVVENIDEDNLDLEIVTKGDGEVAKLTASFNRMFSRIRDYTRRLQKTTLELDRAHRQTRSTLSLIQEIGAQPNLQAVSSYLIRKFEEIIACREMQLIVFDGNHNILFMLPDNSEKSDNDSSFAADIMWLSQLEKTGFRKNTDFESTLLSNPLKTSRRVAVFPIRHEIQSVGVLMIPCPRDCRCDTKELEVIEMILNQSSGAIHRTVVNEAEIRELQGRIEVSKEFRGIVGKDAQMQTVYKLIEDIAPTDATVLISGETGTGKELVAQAIHQQSTRSDQAFVVINCSAYPATLLEGELFGHEKGAFTGAIRQKSGRFEQADKGTIFLDEIGEISPSAQIKLLRVIQTQKFERLGGERTLSVDVRIISASNKDLIQEVKAGRFREDLFYRLNVIPIRLPPLKNRRNDIPLLARHFLNRFSAEQGKNLKEFGTEAMRLLLDYKWPGNVRELENSIEHAVVLAKGERVELSDLPAGIRTAIGSLSSSSFDDNEEENHGTIMENEARLLKEALDACGWNKKKAAQRLGISRSTLYDKLKKYQISPTVH